MAYKMKGWSAFTKNSGDKDKDKDKDKNDKHGDRRGMDREGTVFPGGIAGEITGQTQVPIDSTQVGSRPPVTQERKEEWERLRGKQLL